MKYVVDTPKTPSQALEDLQEAVKRHGFGVLHIYDLKQTLASKGFDLPNECHILEICSPQQAVDVLRDDMDMNIALPCRVSVYTESGRTKIATAQPTKMLAALSDSHELARIAKDVEDKITAMIKDAS